MLQVTFCAWLSGSDSDFGFNFYQCLKLHSSLIRALHCRSGCDSGSNSDSGFDSGCDIGSDSGCYSYSDSDSDSGCEI